MAYTSSVFFFFLNEVKPVFFIFVMAYGHLDLFYNFDLSSVELINVISMT